jgi:hypothetical protein
MEVTILFENNILDSQNADLFNSRQNWFLNKNLIVRE